ncbi:MAG: zf-HC2 domain-containing protein [Woeseiaceae bacterium]|nr:zf-HC2 domain-containing protein [Woeseiaceae bacterium]
MIDVSQQTAHEQCRLLLPWYANDTLDDGERSRVASHVEDCEQCARELAEHRRLRSAVMADAAVPIVPSRSARDVFGRMPLALASKSRSTYSDWRVAAAIGCIALLAGIVGYQILVGERPEPQFRTVTTGEQAPGRIDYVVELELRASVDDAGRQALVESMGAVDVIATGNRLRVTVPNQLAALHALDDFAARLREHPDVVSADIVALQLPVQ